MHFISTYHASEVGSMFKHAVRISVNHSGKNGPSVMSVFNHKLHYKPFCKACSAILIYRNSDIKYKSEVIMAS